MQVLLFVWLAWFGEDVNGKDDHHSESFLVCKQTNEF